MKPADFEFYKTYLKEKSGLVLNEEKMYLVESRLNPVAKKWELESIDDLTTAMRGSPSSDMVKDVVEAMTINETSFFRDNTPFDNLKENVIPYYREQKPHHTPLKIWCAAASSGQEPYSIALTLVEMIKAKPGWDFQILGTDISTEILDQASKGIYSQFEVQRGMPITMLMNYFTQQDDKWAIKDEIKRNIRFEQFNLLDSMAGKGIYDVIFCRNVLIYFDEKTKGDILERMSKQLAPDGFLFLGGAETVLGITDIFKPIPGKRGLYALDGSIHITGEATATTPVTPGTQALA